jgi:methylenetetrahydrofolate dehydrogenase (NADP+)/methenyltetrahydrofolate cyclohydrolase
VSALVGTARLIDGKAIAARLCAEVAEDVAALKAAGIQPGLAVVLVGEDPASRVYVRNKVSQTTEVGMASFEHRMPDTVSEAELLALISRLNADGAVHGILVQLPLPKHIDERTVLRAIDPAKDVDGAMMLIRSVRVDLAGANAVVIGRSNIVGKPMAQLLLAADCTVTIAHSRTQGLVELCREADILIAAVGRPGMVKGDWIKPGAVVIDIGINRMTSADGKSRLVGDVDFAAAAERAGAITPVPGGAGPMTIACLLRNTLHAARNMLPA